MLLPLPEEFTEGSEGNRYFVKGLPLVTETVPQQRFNIRSGRGVDVHGPKDLLIQLTRCGHHKELPCQSETERFLTGFLDPHVKVKSITHALYLLHFRRNVSAGLYYGAGVEPHAGSSLYLIATVPSAPG